jgi:hypothetical protein
MSGLPSASARQQELLNCLVFFNDSVEVVFNFEVKFGASVGRRRFEFELFDFFGQGLI